MKQIQYITTKALISKGDKVFMLQDRAGNWELPGGKIDFGETPKEALEREIGEELGIDDAKIGRLLNVWSFISADPRLDGEDQSHFIVLVYECTADLSKAKLSDEHQACAWINFDQIQNYEMKEGYRESFELYKEANNI